ncbi:hypothetical protein QUF64_02480 [Anaerolineales bacterium HSG6]|nr:hypothetical protein [Anaerolineales bacterium HSG6]
MTIAKIYVVVKMMLKMERWFPANMSAGSRRAVNPLFFRNEH